MTKTMTIQIIKNLDKNMDHYDREEIIDELVEPFNLKLEDYDKQYTEYCNLVRPTNEEFENGMIIRDKMNEAQNDIDELFSIAY